jgi:hypothetical protein
MKGSWEAEKCLENRKTMDPAGGLKGKKVIHIPSSWNLVYLENINV